MLNSSDCASARRASSSPNCPVYLSLASLPHHREARSISSLRLSLRSVQVMVRPLSLVRFALLLVLGHAAADQIWNVAVSRTLTVGAVSLAGTTTGLTFTGAGNTTTGTVTLANAATFTNSGTGLVTFGAVTGTNVGITKAGSGALTISG